MTKADDIHLIAPGVFVWHAFDGAAKVDLWSSAVAATAGLYIIDPIPLREPALKQLGASGRIAAVIVMNANHERASHQFGEYFGAPVWNGRELAVAGKPDNDTAIVPIPGAAPDEAAICVRGTLVVADALINFPPHGFTFLPAKYCENTKQMRQSLGELLRLKFERILFGHGQPITTKAREQLTRLLESA